MLSLGRAALLVMVRRPDCRDDMLFANATRAKLVSAEAGGGVGSHFQSRPEAHARHRMYVESAKRAPPVLATCRTQRPRLSGAAGRQSEIQHVKA